MKTGRHHLLYFGALALVLCAAPAMSPPALAQTRVTSDDVPKAMVERLLKIVGGQPQLRSLEGKPVVFVSAEAVRVKNESAGPVERPPTLYQTTHYRYADDVTVFTTVDVERNAVVATREAKHVPTPITVDELAEATRLARADQAVRAALGRQAEGTQTEALGLYTDDRRDPLYGHRALNLVFHRGDLYVANLEVIVDLTARKVSVTRRGSGNEMQH